MRLTQGKTVVARLGHSHFRRRHLHSERTSRLSQMNAMGSEKFLFWYRYCTQSRRNWTLDFGLWAYSVLAWRRAVDWLVSPAFASRSRALRLVFATRTLLGYLDGTGRKKAGMKGQCSRSWEGTCSFGLFVSSVDSWTWTLGR